MAEHIYLKVAGVEGESLEANHKGWIEVSDVHYSISNASSFAAGSGQGQGATQLSPISVTAKTGKHSPDFLRKCMNGTPFETMEFEWLKQTGDSAGQVAHKLKLKFAYVSSLSPNLSGEPMEHFSITCEDLEVEYFKQESGGNLVSAGGAGFDTKAKQSR